MISNKAQQEKGFTLIELLLAMAGVSVLLIAIATTTMQLMNLYHKGMSIKSINSAGREIGDMIKRDGLSAKGSSIGYVAPTDPGAKSMGRLCFGSYSYVWNTPENLLSTDVSRGVSYQDSGSTKIVLARAADPNGSLCKTVSGQYPDTISQSSPMNAVELLGNKTTGIAIHKVSVTELFADANRRSGYTIRYMIGTYEDGTIDSMNSQCLTQSEESNNYTFCAINEFSETIITERSI